MIFMMRRMDISVFLSSYAFSFSSCSDKKSKSNLRTNCSLGFLVLDWITCVVESTDGAAVGFYFILVSLLIAHNYEVSEFEFTPYSGLDWFGSFFLLFLRLLLWFGSD